MPKNDSGALNEKPGIEYKLFLMRATHLLARLTVKEADDAIAQTFIQ